MCNLVPAQAGTVTVGLASHWPCVTDNSGTTTYGLMALGREMSTPHTLQPQLGHFTSSGVETVGSGGSMNRGPRATRAPELWGHR